MGFGKEVVKRIIEYIKTFPYGQAEYVYAAWAPDNKASEKLCLDNGFDVVKIDEDDEAVRARLQING